MAEEKKRRKFLSPGACSPRKILKVETKICAIWGTLGANLKKSITPKCIMYISFVLSICIHRSVILIFIEKKYACQGFFSMVNIFFRNFWFSFPRESSFPRRIPGSDLYTMTLHKSTVSTEHSFPHHNNINTPQPSSYVINLTWTHHNMCSN